MTITNMDTASYLSWKLRSGLTDYNSASRVGTHWIYSDKPRITDLLKNKHNFPRVAVTNQDESTFKSMGLQCTQHHDLTQIAINVYVPGNLTCEINNVASEGHVYVSGTSEYTLLEQPVSTIGATIDGTLSGAAHSFIKDTDYALTYGLTDKIAWLVGDIPDVGTTFTVGYSQRAAGAYLAQIIGRDIKQLIREQWRNWYANDKRLTDFKVVSSKPVEIDAYQQIERYEIFCSFKGINLDE